MRVAASYSATVAGVPIWERVTPITGCRVRDLERAVRRLAETRSGASQIGTRKQQRGDSGLRPPEGRSPLKIGQEGGSGGGRAGYDVAGAAGGTRGGAGEVTAMPASSSVGGDDEPASWDTTALARRRWDRVRDA